MKRKSLIIAVILIFIFLFLIIRASENNTLNENENNQLNEKQINGELLDKPSKYEVYESFYGYSLSYPTDWKVEDVFGKNHLQLIHFVSKKNNNHFAYAGIISVDIPTYIEILKNRPDQKFIKEIENFMINGKKAHKLIFKNKSDENEIAVYLFSAKIFSGKEKNFSIVTQEEFENIFVNSFMVN